MHQCLDLEEYSQGYEIADMLLVILPEDDLRRDLSWLEVLIEKRVAAIMEENRRKYYWECAAYIAAFGEVLESLGEAGGKQRFMLDYKKKYSRRSAFHRELEAYGMKRKK